MQLSEFFFNIPLYDSIIINEENQLFFNMLIGEIECQFFEGFNPIEKTESTFDILSCNHHCSSSEQYANYGGYATLTIKCKRYENLFRFYIFWDAQTKELTKIGQYPSVADFHTSQVKQYAKLLKKEDIQEFTKAIGLAAHGVGIGSFVYLRRVFENLINEAYEQALADNVLSESDFQTVRMDEKIQLLKDFLPAFLVEHKTLYSILSLGIHSLDETTCLAHFDIVRTGIEIILDEKLEAQRKQEKIAEASKKIKALPSQLKNG